MKVSKNGPFKKCRHKPVACVGCRLVERFAKVALDGDGLRRVERDQDEDEEGDEECVKLFRDCPHLWQLRFGAFRRKTDGGRFHEFSSQRRYAIRKHM